MKKLSKYYTVCLGLLSLFSFAQRIDNTTSFRRLVSNHYLRFHYDNDYFGSSDYYYTQGYNLEFITPRLIKNPINSLFIKLKNSEQKYGVALEHVGFTATDIRSDEILFGDRPFSGAIMIKAFMTSTDTIHGTHLSSTLNIGIIGPATGGKELQTLFHRWIDNTLPKGWQHQIKNDVLLNYQIAHEKQLYRLHDAFALNSNATIRLGTVNTNISGGLSTTFGKINSPFTSVKNKNGFHIYGYLQSLVSVIGYDAGLQGGLFNRKSPYTIADSDMERVTFQTNFGLIMHYKRLYFEYSRSELTKEFRTGNSHKWGGIRIGYKY